MGALLTLFNALVPVNVGGTISLLTLTANVKNTSISWRMASSSGELGSYVVMNVETAESADRDVYFDNAFVDLPLLLLCQFHEQAPFGSRCRSHHRPQNIHKCWPFEKRQGPPCWYPRHLRNDYVDFFAYHQYFGYWNHIISLKTWCAWSFLVDCTQRLLSWGTGGIGNRLLRVSNVSWTRRRNRKGVGSSCRIRCALYLFWRRMISSFSSCNLILR